LLFKRIETGGNKAVRKKKEDALETRNKLLESALDVMGEKPFSSVSMSEVAERVGLSKGAVYWHFKNKGDLLVSVVGEVCDKVWRDFYDTAIFSEGLSGLRYFFMKKMDSCVNNVQIQKINRLMHRNHEWPEAIAKSILSAVRDMLFREQEILSEIIDRAQKNREIRDDIPARDISLLMSAIFQGMFFYQINEFYNMDFVKYSDFIFSALERELRYGDNIVAINNDINNDTKSCALKETV
jgi:TetR/AcrR family acrAB operon transcriptional repressor